MELSSCKGNKIQDNFLNQFGKNDQAIKDLQIESEQKQIEIFEKMKNNKKQKIFLIEKAKTDAMKRLLQVNKDLQKYEGDYYKEDVKNIINQKRALKNLEEKNIKLKMKKIEVMLEKEVKGKIRIERDLENIKKVIYENELQKLKTFFKKLKLSDRYR